MIKVKRIETLAQIEKGDEVLLSGNLTLQSDQQDRAKYEIHKVINTSHNILRPGVTFILHNIAWNNEFKIRLINPGDILVVDHEEK